jgi:hypothetical protein
MDSLLAKIAGLAFALALPSAPLWAQGQCTDLPKVVLQPGLLVAPGYRSVGLAIKRGDSITLEVDTLPLDLTGLARAETFQRGMHRGEQPVFLWTRADNTKCWSAIESPPREPAEAVGAAAATRSCRSEEGVWQDTIQAVQKKNGYTVLVFDAAGNLCAFNREYGIEGDAIYVGIFTPSSISWAATFENCALEPAGPRVYVPPVTFPTLLPVTRGTGPEPTTVLRAAGPRHCFSEQVDIVMRRDSGGAKEYRYPLRQYRRYEATLQFGVIFSTLHDQSYGLRGDTIFSKGPTGTGPEYAATVVLYSLPRQLAKILGKDRYQGRDIVHDRDWQDRIGGMLGVSLQNPGRRFTAGITVEVLNGLNILLGWEWARVTELAGVTEGVELPSGATIPTRDRWRNAFVYGASIDLNYVAALFSQKK